MIRPARQLSVKKDNNYRYRDFTGTGIRLWWLGQAGFILRFKKTTLLLDPYLSDVLAIKYRGNKYPHKRMISPPVELENLTDIDYFISTHSHSDHMDPGLIPKIRQNNPDCLFILPEASIDIGMERGIPKNRIICMDDGRKALLKENISIHGVASAHEKLAVNSHGYNLYLGYVLEFGELVVYHSGDCIPYPGLKEKLEPYRIDLSLLPVNGRTKTLSSDGIAGNFNYYEAVDLMKGLQIPFMIPHHYGMFSFNTVNVNDLKKIIKEQKLECKVYPAEINMFYQMEGFNG